MRLSAIKPRGTPTPAPTATARFDDAAAVGEADWVAEKLVVCCCVDGVEDRVEDGIEDDPAVPCEDIAAAREVAVAVELAELTPMIATVVGVP
jgi:hypothetical protein